MQGRAAVREQGAQHPREPTIASLEFLRDRDLPDSSGVDTRDGRRQSRRRACTAHRKAMFVRSHARATEITSDRGRRHRRNPHHT
jgi:hypothetical protein